MEIHHTRRCFSDLPLSIFGDPVPIVAQCPMSSLTGLAPGALVWSSAAVAHLLQGSTCWVFRDALLQTSVLTSGYLSLCCLSISSNQSGHSPLNLCVYISIYCLFWTNLPQRWLVKILVDAVCEILKSAPLGVNFGNLL